MSCALLLFIVYAGEALALNAGDDAALVQAKVTAELDNNSMHGNASFTRRERSDPDAECVDGVPTDNPLFPYATNASLSCAPPKFCVAECGDVVYNMPLQCPDNSVCEKPTYTNGSRHDGCNLPTSGLTHLFLDFDGTIELNDELAEDVNKQLKIDYDEVHGPGSFANLTDTDPRGNNGDITGQDMIMALYKVKANLTEDFIQKYFDKTGRRLNLLKKALAFTQGKKVKNIVMSASWAPISAEAWGQYLKNVTGSLGLVFDSIETVADPGGKTPGNKGRKMAELMDNNLAGAVHVDNSFKYLQQVIWGDRMQGVKGAGGGLSPKGVECADIQKITDTAGLRGLVCSLGGSDD